jgi:cephalosporin hydroxylase
MNEFLFDGDSKASNLEAAISIIRTAIGSHLVTGKDVTILGLGTFFRSHESGTVCLRLEPPFVSIADSHPCDHQDAQIRTDPGRRAVSPETVAATRLESQSRKTQASGIPTYFDNYIRWVASLDPNSPGGRIDEKTYLDLVAPVFLEGDRQTSARFQSYSDRRATTSRLIESGLLNGKKLYVGSEVPDGVMAKSQGGGDCYTWRGIPVYKSVFDVCLYAMLLWDLKPKTIFELGSGQGGTAALLSDLSSCFDIDCKVVSIDRYKPSLSLQNVLFLSGDVSEMAQILNRDDVLSLDHPWLIIEDVHAHIVEALLYFDRFSKRGDYLVVEDSLDKCADVQKFLLEASSEYQVDTKYTDFFGRNATSSIDSIFRNQGIR